MDKQVQEMGGLHACCYIVPEFLKSCLSSVDLKLLHKKVCCHYTNFTEGQTEAKSLNPGPNIPA